MRGNTVMPTRRRGRTHKQGQGERLGCGNGRHLHSDAKLVHVLPRRQAALAGRAADVERVVVTNVVERLGHGQQGRAWA